MRWRPIPLVNLRLARHLVAGSALAMAVIVVSAAIAAVGIVLSVQGYERAKRDVRIDRAKLARDTAVEASSLVAIRLEYLSGIAASRPVVDAGIGPRCGPSVRCSAAGSSSTTSAGSRPTGSAASPRGRRPKTGRSTSPTGST